MKRQLTCEELVRYLSDYIDQELDADLSQAAREHLSTCHNCRVVLDSTQKVILLYQDAAHARAIPAERQKRLHDDLAAIFAQRPPAPAD